MHLFTRTLRYAIVTISPLLILSGCSGNNPVNQIVELIKNELIPIVDKECNCTEKPDDPVITNDFSGCWSIKQSTGDVGTFKLTQSDCTISGVTDWDNHENGKITGTVKGSTITFIVVYPKGDTVTYKAMLNDDASSITGGKAQSLNGNTFLWDAAKGTCTIKKIDGCWSVDQNNGHIGILTFKQNGSAITGSSGWTTHSNGPIEGTVDGDKISFTITYPEGVIGYYDGTISEDGTALINGISKSSTGDQATWSAKKTVCEVTIPNIQGCWAVDQNNGHIGILTFQQSGSAITGTSGWTTHSNGPIKGTIEGTTLSFTITYPEGVIGYYDAVVNINESALINGITKSSTGDKAQWNAKKTVCAEQPGCHNLSKDQYTLALYHFDETDGSTLIDETGKASGKITGATRVSGMCGNALQFKTGEYATFDTILPNNLPEGTIELSVKFDSDLDPTKIYSIFGNDGSRIQIIYKNGSILFSKNHSDIFKYTQSAFAFTPDKWYDIAVTWGSKGMRIFIDGKQVSVNTDASVYQASPRTTAENIFYIGKKSWCCMGGFGISTDLSFKGSVDEIRVSSVVRY